MARRALTVLSALLGMVLGYFVWIGAGMVAVASSSVGSWGLTLAFLLVGFTAGALLAARRCRSPMIATMLRWSPVLPVTVGGYLAVCLLV